MESVGSSVVLWMNCPGCHEQTGRGFSFPDLVKIGGEVQQRACSAVAGADHQLEQVVGRQSGVCCDQEHEPAEHGLGTFSLIFFLICDILNL